MRANNECGKRQQRQVVLLLPEMEDGDPRIAKSQQPLKSCLIKQTKPSPQIQGTSGASINEFDISDLAVCVTLCEEEGI